jgi:predicted nucleotidyltransferase
MAEADVRVDAVYLFGSHAAGAVRPTSDVDFAVLLEPAAPIEDVHSVQYLLEDVAEERLGLPVDVVILRWDLRPPLLFEIFCREIVLFARDADRAHNVACRARAEYRDELPRLERAWEKLRRRIEGWSDATEQASVGVAATPGQVYPKA